MGFIISAFNNSEGMGKSIVGLLLFASCICWSIVLNKRVETSQIVSQCKRFLTIFGKHKFSAPLRVFGELDTNKKVTGPLAALTKAVRETLVATLKLDSIQKAKLLEEGVLPRPLKQSELDALRATVNREMTQQVIQLESGLTMMTTIISLAPMLGLFGTVWGVLVTFMGIHDAGGRPDIAAIAPGIAGALLTTVCGLFVAIPAIFFNNFSVRATNDIINNLELYSEDLFSALLTASEAAAQEMADKEPKEPSAPANAPTVIVQTVAPPPAVAPAPVPPSPPPVDYVTPAPAPSYYDYSAAPPPAQASQEYGSPAAPEPPPRQVQRPVPPPSGY